MEGQWSGPGPAVRGPRRAKPRPPPADFILWLQRAQTLSRPVSFHCLNVKCPFHAGAPGSSFRTVTIGTIMTERQKNLQNNVFVFFRTAFDNAEQLTNHASAFSNYNTALRSFSWRCCESTRGAAGLCGRLRLVFSSLISSAAFCTEGKSHMFADLDPWTKFI